MGIYDKVLTPGLLVSRVVVGLMTQYISYDVDGKISEKAKAEFSPLLRIISS